MNVTRLEKVRKIVGIIYLITMAAAVTYMCYGIYTTKTSPLLVDLPWWSACYFTLMAFGPFLVLELLFFVLLHYYIKKFEDANQKAAASEEQ